MSWKDKLKHAFIAAILGVILFGLVYFFDIYGINENNLRLIPVAPIIVLPPMGLFALMSRKRKAAPSVVSATAPPRTILDESAVEEFARLKKETPAERIERLKREANLQVSGLTYSTKPEGGGIGAILVKPEVTPLVQPQPPTKVPTTGYCVKCKVERVIVEPKGDTMKNGRPVTKGTCPACSSQIFRIGVFNGQADNQLPIPITVEIAGERHQFQMRMTPEEIIRKMERPT